MRLEIKHDLKRLERDLGRIGSAVIEKAAPSAINRTTKSVASVAVKSISKTTGIKQKDVRTDIKAKLADRQHMTAYVDATAGRAKTLAGFITPARRKPSEGAGSPQFFRKKTRRGFKHRGVQAKAWNKPKVYAGSFIGRGKSNNVLVFTRTAPNRRSKLKVLSGPSIRQEFNREPMQRSMTNKANERFPIEMDRSVNQVLRRFRR